jgi:hypothetical protein
LRAKPALSEAEKCAITALYTDLHWRRTFSEDDGDWQHEYSAIALLFHEFVEGLEKLLTPENFALVAVFFESVYLWTRPQVGLEPRQ